MKGWDNNRAVSQHDLRLQLVNDQTNSESSSGGADYPTCCVSILVGRIYSTERVFFLIPPPPT